MATIVQESQTAGKGLLLALAIILLWLAGLGFFIAFEGSGILGETVPAKGGGGASYFGAAIKGLASNVQKVANEGSGQ